MYWLLLFANAYDLNLFQKWLSSAVQALIQRFVAMPFLRASVFAVIATCSKLGTCCDGLILCFPHVLPKPEPNAMESSKKAFALGGCRSDEAGVHETCYGDDIV
jgi:hypothetical protein